MTKAVFQPEMSNVMVYMVAVPYGSDVQQQQPGWSPDTGGTDWANESWQMMPEQSQQWTAGWADQSQQYFVPQQFQQGNVLLPPYDQQMAQEVKSLTQKQILPLDQTQSGQVSIVPSASESIASGKPKRKGLVNKPLQVTKETGSVTPAVAHERSQEQLEQVPIPALQLAPHAPPQPKAKKGLVNKAIAKNGTPVVANEHGSDKNQPTVVEDSPTTAATPRQEKRTLDMKAIAAWQPLVAHGSDDNSMIKALGLEPVHPTRVRPQPGNKDITPVMSTKLRPSETTSQDLKAFAQNFLQLTKRKEAKSDMQASNDASIHKTCIPEQQRPKGFRLKNAILLPQGDTKVSTIREAEASKLVELKIDDEKEYAQAPELSSDSKDSCTDVRGEALVKGFSRLALLRFRNVENDIADLGYQTASRDENESSPREVWRNPRKELSWRREAKPSKPIKDAKESLDVLSNRVANPYKKKAELTRNESLAKEVRGLLNKICPENKDKIIKKLGEVQVNNGEELGIVIDIIFHKVTDDPHHCETYVEMVRSLSQVYSEQTFPEEEDQKLDFRRTLVNQCQVKFEDLLQYNELMAEKSPEMEQEEYDELMMKQKRCAMATMKFIGHLYLRKLIVGAVVRNVVMTLLNGTEENPDTPPEFQIEYALELIQAIGETFDKVDKDRTQLSMFLDRLTDLKKVKKLDGKPCLSRRVQFQIQDLMEMRVGGWARSKHKEVAKTIAEVAKDQARMEHESALAAKPARNPKGKGRY
jgi:hypothetical protein